MNTDDSLPQYYQNTLVPPDLDPTSLETVVHDLSVAVNVGIESLLIYLESRKSEENLTGSIFSGDLGTVLRL